MKQLRAFANSCSDMGCRFFLYMLAQVTLFEDLGKYYEKAEGLHMAGCIICLIISYGALFGLGFELQDYFKNKNNPPKPGAVDAEFKVVVPEDKSGFRWL